MIQYSYYMLKHVYVIVSLFNLVLYELFNFFINGTSLTNCITNIVHLAIKKNILFVKVIQALSTEHIFPELVIDILKQNTHSVKYDDSELEPELINHIKQKYDIKLETEKPFHAGMVSVAYYGHMNDKQVVIKILRKNIKERIRDGSENLTFIYYLLYMLCGWSNNSLLMSKLDMLKSITNTTEYLISQCVFSNEIIAIKKTLEELTTYTVCKNIIIPKVYNLEEDINDTNFIILEYLDGKFPADILDVKEREKYLKLYITFSIVQTLFFSYHHTDLHNGNIICLKDENTGELKMGIIDFGMNLMVSKEIKKSMLIFADIIYSNIPIKQIKIHKYCNYFMKNDIDIKKYTKDELNKIDILLYDLFKNIEKGILEESVINSTFTEVAHILNVKMELNMELILILLSLSMTQCCINYLSNYDKTVASKHFKECYLELIE